MHYDPSESFHKLEIENSLFELISHNSDIVNYLYNNDAKAIAIRIYQEILAYQQKLSDSDDVVMSLVSFNVEITMFVQSIGYSGNNLIVFHGADSYGTPLKLIQHISQLNFLLKAAPKLDASVPKRQIGFVNDIES